MAGDAREDEAIDRLEQALNRIEAGIDRPDPVAAEVATRLDAAIARLRSELAGPPADLEG